MKNTHKPSTPFLLTVIRRSIQCLTRISPKLAARFVNYLWFKTHRFPEPKREAESLSVALWETLFIENEHIQVYIWGDQSKPKVLLVHGWNGRAGQLAPFAHELLERGYCIIGFDSPAHGRSKGSNTNLPSISGFIKEIDQKYGPFHAGITHSFGGMCLINAIVEGVSMNKVATISPALNVESLVNIFASTLWIKPEVVKLQRRLLEHQFGSDMWERFSIPSMLKNQSITGLIVHDQHDKDIPITSSEDIAEAWQNSELLKTQKLGHRRILRDQQVLEKVTEFICANPV